jgi:predicted nucleic acid-binding protein
MASQPVALDASTLLNLLASGAGESILRSQSAPLIVVSAVASEVLYIRNLRPEDPPEEVSVEPLLRSGILQLTEPEGHEEAALFVEFASSVDDGEAMSLAICVSRGYVLATDDRKARRVAADASIPLIATSDLIFHWAEQGNSSDEDVRRVLSDIEARGRFSPWVGYPLREWWLKVLT